MNEQHERQLRRKAIRGLLQGTRPAVILQRVGRSREWLSKWRRRFKRAGMRGLRSQSRRPHHHPSAYRAWVRQQVVRLRRQLVRQRVGLIGAEAIRQAWRREQLPRPIPSPATIKRLLRTAHLTGTRVKPAYYPAPRATGRYALHALDWTERYLAEGVKVYAFHTLDLTSRAAKQTISPNKASPTVRAHALNTWRTLGIPDFLQLDNDGVFNGGYKVRRVIGQFVRLCLYVGVELIFLPFDEAERNGIIESFNHLWSRAFYNRRRFRSVAHVARASLEFEAWYQHDYRPSKHTGRKPVPPAASRPRLSAADLRALPEPLPITAGRIHFIRQVEPEGTIRVLNETWPVGKRLAGQYVWATITTHRHTLRIYHRRAAQRPVRLVREYPYPLREPVAPLQPQFRRPYPRRKVSAML
jgi:hypothetical protein